MKNEKLNREIRVAVYNTVFSLIWSIVTNALFWGVVYMVWFVFDLMRSSDVVAVSAVASMFILTMYTSITGVGRQWANESVGKGDSNAQ